MSFEPTAEQDSLRPLVPLVDGVPRNWEILPRPVYTKPQWTPDTLTETSAGWGFIEHPITHAPIHDANSATLAVRPTDLSPLVPTRHEVHIYWAMRASSSQPFIVSPSGKLYPDIQVIRMDPGINGVGIAADRHAATKGAPPLNCTYRQNMLQCDHSIPIHMIIGFPTRAQVNSATGLCEYGRQLMNVDTMVKLLDWFSFVYRKGGTNESNARWINGDAWTDNLVLGNHLARLMQIERSAPNGAQATIERKKYEAAIEDLSLWRDVMTKAYAILDAKYAPDPIEPEAPRDTPAAPEATVAVEPQTKRGKRSA